MARDHDDRPKKSWREVDAARSTSAHRRDSGSSAKAERLERSAAYRSYKTQLNKLFDGSGDIPDALKQKLEEADVGGSAKNKRAALNALLEARSPKDIKQAALAYKEDYGFPEDEQALAKMLELSDEGLLLEALNTIIRLKEEGALKRGTALRARIQTVKVTCDDPDVEDAANAALKLL